MTMIKKFLSTVAAMMIVMATSSCSSDDSNSGTTDGTARIKVHMTDAPGDYEEVNVEVLDVK